MLKRNVVFLACTITFAVTGYSAAPIPENAKGVTIPPDKGYFVGAIVDKIYWITDGFYNTFFAVTGKGVIVVDAPPSLGEKLIKAIREVTQEPITHVIYSHSHADHIGGAHLYPEKAIYIAHEETKLRLERALKKSRPFPYGAFVGGKPVPIPTVTFKKSYELTLGSQLLRLEYHGDDHEPGNIYIFAPKEKVLMKVDIVFPGWSPFENLAIAENTNGYYEAMDKILTFDFDKLVSGHWGRLALRKDVETQREYFIDIRVNAAKALGSVNFQEVGSTTGFENVALLLNTYLKKVSEKCASLTNEKWIGRLGGADVLTVSHCYQVMMALRVD